ncbi:S8 family serine peptidase [Mesorhizobium sp. M0598]|uniref:S8 family serine peptidase n=1 Tax=Mesorhizobium sp. M0598 TaxID=2956968 RepID=UPI00333B305E
MAKKTVGSGVSAQATPGPNLSSSIDELLLAATARGDGTLRTGRYVVTFKEGAGSPTDNLTSLGLRTADARDFADQSLEIADVGDAHAIVLPEIGVAVVSDLGMQTAGLSIEAEAASDSAIQTIEDEYFVFAQQETSDYLRGFLKATEAIIAGLELDQMRKEELDFEAEVAGATWGLVACRVPQSSRSGAGVKVAVLDTGMDLGHPDFAGRPIVTSSFVGQPVQDLHSHGTHCIGTACGPKAPAGSIPRYGIAHSASIFVGKVLSNSGNGSSASVLAGMNWAIANGCAVISMSLGSQSPVQAAYTAAGQAALNRGCLIIAAAGNASSNTGAPANSPTIMSVGSLDQTLVPSNFSNFGKMEIAAPGRDVFSSVPRPTRYGTKSGTSMATPHVAGCAALWAQTSPSLRGQALWNRMLQAARPLPFPQAKVGRGLVQAPA